MVINDKKIKEFLSNLAVALFLNSQFIIRIAQAYIPAVSNFGVKLIFIISFILAVLALRKVEVTRVHLAIPLIVTLFYFITIIIYPGKSELKLFELLVYCVLPFILVWNEIDFRKVVKYTLVLTFPAIFVLGRVFIKYNTVNYAITMVLSHSVVTSVVCAVAYLSYYIKMDKGYEKSIYTVLSLINGIYFYELITYGSRSPAIAVIIFIVVALFFRPDYQNNQVNAHRIKLFIILSAIILVVYLFGDSIISWVFNLFESHGIYNRFLRKHYNLMILGDTSHGRMDIYKTAIEGFRLSPVWGHGIDMFYANTGIAFPHNFILQFVYDGGVILLIIIITPLLYSSIRLLKLNQYDLFMPWLILCCSSVPIIMVSGDIWIKYGFWFFIAYTIMKAKTNYRLYPNKKMKIDIIR